MFTYLLSRLIILTGCSLLFQRPECGAFLFLNTFYNLHIAAQSLPPSVDPSGYALKHQFPMLPHVRREKKVWPPGSRSKPVVDPRKVDTGSVHVVQKLRKGESHTHTHTYARTHELSLAQRERDAKM